MVRTNLKTLLSIIYDRNVAKLFPRDLIFFKMLQKISTKTLNPIEFPQITYEIPYKIQYYTIRSSTYCVLRISNTWSYLHVIYTLI